MAIICGPLRIYLDANADSYSSATQTTANRSDVRNKLSAVAVNGITQARYGYDDDGDRVSETVGGVTTLYLNDKVNPTGYDQPLKAKNVANGLMSLTYILGDHVLGQAASNSQITYLITGGHRLTRMLSSSSMPMAMFNDDAFGDPLNFNPGTVAIFAAPSVNRRLAMLPGHLHHRLLARLRLAQNRDDLLFCEPLRHRTSCLSLLGSLYKQVASF